LTTHGDQRGGTDALGDPVGVVVVTGGSVLDALAGAVVGVGCSVAGGDGVVLVTVGGPDVVVLSGLGRSTVVGPGCGRTMPPIVVPCPPETRCPEIHSKPVMASMPRANVSTVATIRAGRLRRRDCS
jgi:hypothetical protein